MSDEHTITGSIRNPIDDKKAVELFGEEMLIKLLENGHKSHWSTKDHYYLMSRLRDEVKELTDAVIKRYAIEPTTQDIEQSVEIIRECADVANFVMFIADNERRKLDAMK